MNFKIFTLLTFISFSVFSQRTVENINQDWLYLEEAFQSPDQLTSSSNWQAIDLPHSWNSIDATDLIPGYRRDASWYKKSLTFDELEEEKKYILYFEGANIVTSVYVNNKIAGEHIGGYVGFEIDISPFITKGNNEVLVRVDNGYNREIIPSQKSDFFIYGGITRDVWLKKVNSTFIKDVNISTPSVSLAKAETTIDIELNENGANNYSTKVSLIGPSGKHVKTIKADLKTKEQQTISFSINKPLLWDIDNPQLYTLQVELLDKKKVVDQVSYPFGYRWFEFKEFGSFYLNGRKVLLRGTHRHEEHAGFGAAMPNKLHRQDMELIKGMGANFVRLGHYSQDPEVYKACNELGILVWDELPWCRGGVGNQAWKTNTKNLLKEMINQNYNHPSIIFWSLGNEIYWLPDFEDGDNRKEINDFLTELNHTAHQLDPNRLTAIRKYYEGSDIIDVFSPSIWSGWYSGNYKNYANALDKYIDKYPHFLHMEYGGSSHVGRHTESPITGDGFINPSEWEEPINQVEVANIAQRGDWSENYIVDLFDWHLMVTESHDRFAGNAQWAFKDFGTPLRPENDIPYINQKGVTDRAGNPKDAYYVFKSYWSNEPFAYIESHTWTERSGPKDLSREISVFSNANHVEFFHNGNSLGKKNRNIELFPACGLSWDINFNSGENTLMARAYDEKNNEIATDELIVNYRYERATTPEELILTATKNAEGHYLITATARDKDGLRCLEYEDRVYFQCMSGGELVENQGTPTGSSSIRMANGAASIIVIPNNETDEVVMSVLNQSFKGSFLTIEPEKTQ